MEEALRFLDAEYTIVTLASKTEETLLQAPATMEIITAEDIRKRGYTDLSQFLFDLPGFDVVQPGGFEHVIGYQRGYRTNFMQRTLLMIDGKIDNNLWTHSAVISRQYPLSNIERIEVLYGPASAIYGANAFLGMINVITKTGTAFEAGEQEATVHTLAGEHHTRSVDAGVRGRTPWFTYALSGRFFLSDEADLSQKWGFLSNERYSDRQIWGPILDHEQNGRAYGSYYDPSEDWGFIARIGAGPFELGLMRWQKEEGYGAQYAADRAQNNASWTQTSDRLSLDYHKRFDNDWDLKIGIHYRESRVFGDWAESTPEPDSEESVSLIGITYWNSISDSFVYRQEVSYKAGNRFSVSGGIRFERQDQTRAYDVPGYHNAFSSVPLDGEDPHDYGVGIGQSNDPIYRLPPLPAEDMPDENRFQNRTRGLFLQGIYNLGQFRFNTGLHLDQNARFGSSIHPRLSLIRTFHGDETSGALKLLYGTAFQEPAPILLYGNWNDREANENLEPEEVDNLELVVMLKTGLLAHELSVYKAHYDDVITEVFNAGERDISGLEYRGHFSLPPGRYLNLSGSLNYSYTDAESNHIFDFETHEWHEATPQNTGDIAAHKANLILDLSVGEDFRLSLKTHYVGRRELYLRNPLRSQGKTIDPYTTSGGAMTYELRMIRFHLGFENLFDHDYFHPGIENANSGDDFSNRSKGFQNSLLAQPGRMLTFQMSWFF